MKQSLAVALLLLATTAHAAQTERVTLPILDDVTFNLACTQAILDAKAAASAIEALPLDQANVETVLNKWDERNLAYENLLGVASILANVHPDKKTRDAAQDCLVKVASAETDNFQNENLYKRVAAVKTSTQAQELFKADLLENFDDSGVSLPADKRARAKAIFDKLTELSQEFGKNLRDNTTKLTFTPDEYKGLPQSYIDRLKQPDGTIQVTFDYPDYNPFMSSGENAAARKRYYIAYSNRGTEKNLGLIDEVVKLRKELASLYGQPSYASYVIRRRMAETPAAVNKFLGDVSRAVTENEKRELEELRRLKAELTNTPLAQTKIERWDVTYYSERLRERRYNIDQESTRKYFPPDASLAWLMDLTSRNYGVAFKPVAVPVWHPDVQYFDLVDAKSGDFIAGIYLDLFPREGKFKHAAAWPVRHTSTRVGRKPISVLVTNFDRKGLTYGEIETFFHEFGHVMHNTLSLTEYGEQAGTSVKRDFVEAPSQMYEAWAQRPETLALLKAHCKGCPELDAETIARLNEADRYGKGIHYARQHLYAAFDMALAGEKPASAMEIWKQMEGATPLGYVAGTQFPGAFSHHTGGYAAGYYGYLWSEVIAHDFVSAWGDKLLDPEMGRRYRDLVLARGGEVPALSIVQNFLGRPMSSVAFFDYIGGKKKESKAVAAEK